MEIEQKKALFRLIKKSILDFCNSDYSDRIEKSVPKALKSMDYKVFFEFSFKISDALSKKVLKCEKNIIYGIGFGNNKAAFAMELPFKRSIVTEKLLNIRMEDIIF